MFYNFYDSYLKLIDPHLLNVIDKYIDLKKEKDPFKKYKNLQEYGNIKAFDYLEKYIGEKIKIYKEKKDTFHWKGSISSDMEDISFKNYFKGNIEETKNQILEYNSIRDSFEIKEKFQNANIHILKPNTHPIYDVSIKINKSHLDYTLDGKCIIYVGPNYDFEKEGMPDGNFPQEELDFLFKNYKESDSDLISTYQILFDNNVDIDLITLVKTLCQFKKYIELEKNKL